MGRGPRWTEAENKSLLKLIQQGMSAEAIYQSGALPGRTYKAILNQIQRLGAHLSSQKNFSLSTQIREAEIVDLETVVRRFVDAFNKICDLTGCTKEDLERFRIIFSAARVYFDLYFRLEEFGEVRRSVQRLERLVEQLQAEKKRGKAE